MIRLENVSKFYNYNKDNQVMALLNVDLVIEKGEFVAVVGPSGAGKSTLLHIIGGLIGIQNGKYFFEDTDVMSLSEREKSQLRNKKIGIIMQNFALVDDFTVMQNVMIPLYFRRNVKNKKELAIAALKKVDLEHLKNKSVAQLSGGEKQRCAIARCLCQNPSVILADEPTGQLDSQNSEKIIDIFSKLNSDGMTIIIVTHDDKVAGCCKRKIRIKDGRVNDDEKIFTGTRTDKKV